MCRTRRLTSNGKTRILFNLRQKIESQTVNFFSRIKPFEMVNIDVKILIKEKIFFLLTSSGNDFGRDLIDFVRIEFASSNKEQQSIDLT